MKDKERGASWILYLATYPPRECGIATFTQDLAKAVEKFSAQEIKSKILAMNDGVNIYHYPNEVIFQIRDTDVQEYMDLAKKINEIKKIKLVNIQHEFGIYGGEYGSYLIPFLELLTKPVITTFHTVLPSPNLKRKRIVQLIAKKSRKIVVMTYSARKILRNDYGIKTGVEVIPHGAPEVPFNPDNKKEKIEIGFKDKIILSSFGMLSKGKGYEYAIKALPEVVKKFPNLTYLIIGETHPVVRKKEGERYRNFLERQVKRLGLKNNVKFYNKYLKLSEIIKYLKATDIYISSSLNPNQIVSGTLSYAMGEGRAVISTPFLHAKEAINAERGVLLDEFKNPDLFTRAILKILENPQLKKQMEKNTYAYSRKMTWSNVALAYLKVLGRYVKVPEKHKILLPLPKIKLNHLMSLTDDFGVIQFARHAQADPQSGYTLDDNARAMIACGMHYSIFKSKSVLKLIQTYLNFSKYVQQEDGKFYNFVNEAKEIEYEHWSDEAQGRALWSVGYLISLKELPRKLRNTAKELFIKGLNQFKNIKSPRAIASLIMGLYYYNKVAPSSKNITNIKKLANQLLSLYNQQSSDEWQWFEEYLTYSNSKLTRSLFYAYQVTQDKRYLKVAEKTLDFLISLTFEKGKFVPIGQKGWYFKDGKRAYFDQQPVNTTSMVQTLVLANKITKKEEYWTKALAAFQWFLGRNSLNQVIYDESTGGCHDGLGKSSINLNEGAESTLSYLIARLSLSYLNSK